MTTTSPAARNSGAPKKPYESPRLEVYGDIGKITQTVGSSGHADGGHGGMSKTA